MKHDRRAFCAAAMKTATGVWLVGPGGFGPGAQSPAAKRREVVVAGRRVKTIDVHAHCMIPETLEVVKGTKLEGNVKNALNGPLVMGPARLQAMNAQGIDMQVLSINPYWYAAERELARDLIAAQNAGLAKLSAAQPDRFAALASVALQHPDLAAQQLDEGVRKLELRGAALGGSVEGEELASPRFDPFWAKAEELGVLVFIHPQNAPGLPNERLKGNGMLTNVIRNPLETTIALSHLIFEGTLDKFPKLRIGAAHGGGYLPSYAGRSDHGCLTFPENCTGKLQKKPTEYLKQMYFDSLVFTAQGLRHLVAEWGAGQIVLGTDYPFPWTSTAVDHVLNTSGLSDDQKIAILGGNLTQLLRIVT